MTKYIIKRILMIIPVMLVTSIIVFTLVKLSPGDPVLNMLNGKQATQATKDALAAEFNLDKPPVEQYLIWLKNAITGDLGTSYKSRLSVGSMIAEKAGVTAQLVLMSMVIMFVLSIPLGMVCAIKRKRAADIIGSVVTYVCSASPVFFTGLIFVIFLTYKNKWFPSYGTGDSFAENLKYLFLPALALGLNEMALVSRVLRSSMIEALDSNYIETVRAKGMPKRNIYITHAMKNSMMPVVTIAGMQIGFIIISSVLVEQVFGIAGLGSLIITAVKNNDYPLIQATTLLLVLIYITANTLVDIIYVLIDPRVDFEKR